ncbi:MAG: hypothetical protein KBA75_04630 [Alphaproteobacteria bacterium]|nr:hypothetical protein [Alphaproteobacteria bacterium]
METNNELEAIICRDEHGGRFAAPGDQRSVLNVSVLNALECLRTKCQFASQQLYVNNRRPVYADFLWHSSLNGFAYATPVGATPKFDFVGIHVGTILTLQDIFGRILSHPENFPDLGDASKEASTRSHIPFLFTNFLEQGHSYCTPLDRTRHHFAGILFYNALNYLIFHEIGHLIAGHAEFKRSLNNNDHSIATASSGFSNLTSQALEMDADCFAIYCAINEAYRARDGMRNFLAMNPRPKAPMDTEAQKAGEYSLRSNKSLVQGVCFSVYVFFRIFDCQCWDLVNPTQYTHPQPPIRQHWIIQTIENLFRTNTKYDYAPDEFAKDVVETIMLAERACANIQNAEPDYRGILSVFNAESNEREYLASVKNEYNRIRPILNVYKRAKSLPA